MFLPRYCRFEIISYSTIRKTKIYHSLCWFNAIFSKQLRSTFLKVQYEKAQRDKTALIEQKHHVFTKPESINLHDCRNRK